MKVSWETIKLVVAVLIGCALLWLGQTILDWKAGYDQNQQRGRTAEATSGIISDGAKADAQRGEVKAGVAEGRQEFTKDIEEGERNEPTVRSRADGAVPASVREAFRKRRLNRERLGCVGEQCRARPGSDDAAQRQDVLR